MENNYIYDKLVRDENDFHGLVAYGLYKRHKIDYIKQLKKEKNIDCVSDEDLKSFHISSNTPSQLDSYMLQAESLLSETFISMMQDQVEIEVDSARKNIKKEIKSVLPGWGQTLTISVISSIVASLITAAVFMFVSFKINFDDTVDKMQKSEQHVEQMISNFEKTGNEQ